MTQHVEHHTVNAIVEVVGPGNVLTDDEACRYYSSDLFFDAQFPPLAVVSPGTRDEAIEAVRLATDDGLAVVPRGGGLSYTAGYVPQERRSLILDTVRLNRILDINDDDRYATVEVGVTWEVLERELATRGLRVGHFGPATGRVSTIGGGLSQNTVLFGSAQHGTAADNVLGLEVVLPDGSHVHTGSGGTKNGEPFFRYHGPDLTGLFLGDCGAFGVQLAATMQLIPRPPAQGYLSFSFPTFEAMLNAVCEVGRAGLASEVLGSGHYVAPGDKDTDAHPTMHMVVEGLDLAEVNKRLDRLRVICSHQGQEQDAALPRMLRAEPFGFVQSLLDDGRLQCWTHGIVPFSRALSVFSAIAAYFNQEAKTIARHGIDITISAGVMGAGVLLEPVMRWHGPPSALHLRGLGREEAWTGSGDRSATQAVSHLRHGLRDLFIHESAAHLQIGKFYGYRESLQPDTSGLIQRVKHALDPNTRMNPGALGLG